MISESRMGAISWRSMEPVEMTTPPTFHQPQPAPPPPKVSHATEKGELLVSEEVD